MSLYEVKSGLLALGPRVWHQGGRIYVRTNLLLQVLALGSYTRTVVVDPEMRRVDVGVRHVWVWARHRFIPFAHIDHIDYRYGSLGTDFGLFHGTTDRVERFLVELVLDDGERVPVASFRGEGSAMTGLGGVVFSRDSVIDYAGNQEDTSRALVDLLVEAIGVPLGKPMSSARVFVCSACGRHAGRGEARCSACGGAVQRARP
jgi:hypothetical protein